MDENLYANKTMYKCSLRRRGAAADIFEGINLESIKLASLQIRYVNKCNHDNSCQKNSSNDQDFQNVLDYLNLGISENKNKRKASVNSLSSVNMELNHKTKTNKV